MYQVYTQQRPGRPRWALGSSAILLLLTVGMAYALIEYKNRSGLQITRDGLSVTLPAGWEETARRDLPADTVVAAERPNVPDNRMVLVFSGELRGRRANTPVRFVEAYCRRSLESVLQFRGDFRVDQLPKLDHERIAGLPAATIRLTCLSSPPVYCLTRVGEVEPHKVIGVVILAIGDLHAGDARLLERVAEKMRLLPTASAPAEGSS